MFDGTIQMSRVAISLFGFNIYWYGFIITLGVVLAATEPCDAFSIDLLSLPCTARGNKYVALVVAHATRMSSGVHP